MREQALLLLIMVLQARVCSTVDMRPVFDHLARALSDRSQSVVAAAEKVRVRVIAIAVCQPVAPGLESAIHRDRLCVCACVRSAPLR